MLPERIVSVPNLGREVVVVMIIETPVGISVYDGTRSRHTGCAPRAVKNIKVYLHEFGPPLASLCKFPQQVTLISRVHFGC